MRCAHCAELLPAYLDGDLSEAEQHPVAEHLATCLACRALLRGLRRVETLAASQPTVPQPMHPQLAQIDAHVQRYLHSYRRPNLGVRLLQSGWRVTAKAVPVLLMGLIGLLVVFMGAPTLHARLSLESARQRAPLVTPAPRSLGSTNPPRSPAIAQKSATATDGPLGGAAPNERGSAASLAQASAASLPPAIRKLPAPIRSLASDPADDRTVYALLATDALYRSDDAGQTWRRLPLPLAEDTSLLSPADQEDPVFLASQNDILVAPRQPNRVFVAAAHVLYRSDDRGVTWSSVIDAVSAWTVADPNGNDVYAWHDPATSAARGLYRSSDAGSRWSEVDKGVFPPTLAGRPCRCSHEGITSLAVDPRFADTLYAGSDFGVYRSTDGGKSWEPLEPGLPATAMPYRSTPLLTVATDGTVYAVTEVWTSPTASRAALIRRRPGETAWTVVGGNAFVSLQDPQRAFHGIYALVGDPARASRLYLGTSHGLAMSDDGGATWRSVTLPRGSATFRIAAGRVDPNANQKATPALDLETDQGFVRLPPAGER